MSKLAHILASTRARVAVAKDRTSHKALEKLASEHTPRGFRHAIAKRAIAGPAIIAELKKASPSKGIIRPNFQAAPLARELATAGATCLSVLTEPDFFQGSLGNLELASSDTRLPCLRKDFIVDEFQVLEARAHRADAILLIVAALTDSELKHFSALAKSIGLDVLCEVHSAQELDRATSNGCIELLGVNNRDLHDFSVSLQTSLELVEKMPPNSVRVSESGIHSGADISLLRAAGFHGVLVGENLMRAEHPGEALHDLIQSAQAVGA
ncbi:MAG: indole-3-glycerol phosphate synthase TrpC [Acidobacteriaceae bacterium]